VLAEPSVEVLAITCVAGNCKLEGSAKPILGPLRLPDWTGHGSDGLGNHSLSADFKPPSTSPQATRAVDAIIHYADKFPGEVHLVTLGPLTNVALAVSLDPTLPGKVASVTSMMGTYTGQGNVSCSAEFNVASDPEAAAIVMENKWRDLQMITWCLTVENGVSWTWYRENIANANSYLGKMIRQITLPYLALAPVDGLSGERDNTKKFNPCDLVATTCFLYPDSIKMMKKLWCVVELQGKFSRGATFFDHHNHTHNEPNCSLIFQLDQEVIQNALEALLKWSPPNKK